MPEVVDQKPLTTNEWQARLRNSTIAPAGQDAIIKFENGVATPFDARGQQFVDELVVLYQRKGRLTLQDITRSMSDAMDHLDIDIGEVAVDVMVELHGAAVHSAHERSNTKTAMRTVADIRDEQRIKDAIGRALTKITTIPTEAINHIREKLMEEHQKSPQNIMRELLLEKEIEISEAGVADIREAINDIWTEQRYIYQRIVRTETINAYARTQLEEWLEQGLTEVTRHSIDDSKTCAICRELSRPGVNVYKIEDLLRLEYPLTQDPKTGGWLTHPHCRCSFRPKVNWDFLDEIESDLNLITIPPDFEHTTDFSSDESVVSNAPIEHKDGIAKLFERDDPEGRFEFVPDVSEDERWRNERRAELERFYGPAEGKRRYDAETREHRGRLNSSVLSDGTMLVSGYAGDTFPVGSILLRPKAERTWELLDEGDKASITRTFKDKKKTESFTLEEQGIQVFGGEPFISTMAAQSPKDYFVESYLSYVNEPVKIRYMDAGMFLYLMENVFGGRDFSEVGGIS